GTLLDVNSSFRVPALSNVSSFPDGYAGSAFQEYLAVANPGQAAAHVTVTFVPRRLVPSASVPAEGFTVWARSRATRNIRRDTLGLADKAEVVGLLVRSDQPIMVERVLYLGSG